AFEHEALPFGGCEDGGELRGICRQWAEGLRDGALVVQALASWIRRGIIEGMARTVHEMIDDLVLQQVVEALRRVPPHQELREGEETDPRDLENLPTILVANRLTHCPKDARNVESGVVHGESIEARDLDPVV